MGDRGGSSTHHPPQYVPAHHQARAEGGGEVHLLRPLAEPAKARPRGRHTQHTTCRVPDLPQRDQRPLLWCIFPKMITWPTALQALVEGGGYPGHPVLPEEPLAQVRGHHHAGGGPMRGCCSYPYWSANGSPDLGPWGGKTSMMRPSGRPERLSSMHWRPPTCWTIISID